GPRRGHTVRRSATDPGRSIFRREARGPLRLALRAGRHGDPGAALRAGWVGDGFGPGVAPARPEPRACDDDFDRAARRFGSSMSLGRASGTTRAHVGPRYEVEGAGILAGRTLSGRRTILPTGVDTLREPLRRRLRL